MRGDVLDIQAMSETLPGQDAVVYVKSTVRTVLQSTRLLLAAMEKQQVRRLVCITGVGEGETKGHGGFLYDHFIFPLLTNNRYATQRTPGANNPPIESRLDARAASPVQRGKTQHRFSSSD